MSRAGSKGADLPELSAGLFWNGTAYSMSPKLREYLDELTKRENTGIDAIIPRAIALYRILSEAREQGKHVGIAADSQCLETEICGF